MRYLRAWRGTGGFIIRSQLTTTLEGDPPKTNCDDV